MSRAKGSKSKAGVKVKVKAASAPKMRRKEIRVLDSMAEADQYDREYWWSRTPAERMRALEKLRQLKYGYGPGKPRPKFEPIVRVMKLGDDESKARVIYPKPRKHKKTNRRRKSGE